MTCGALRRDPGGWVVLGPATEWSSYLKHSTLAITELDGLSDRPDPINRLVVPIPGAYMFFPTVFANLHRQEVPNPYLLGSRRRWLKVNCIERIGIWPQLKTYSQLEYTSRVSPSQPRRIDTFSTQVGLFGGWWSTGLAKNKHHLWNLPTKKP